MSQDSDPKDLRSNNNDINAHLNYLSDLTDQIGSLDQLHELNNSGEQNISFIEEIKSLVRYRHTFDYEALPDITKLKVNFLLVVLSQHPVSEAEFTEKSDKVKKKYKIKSAREMLDSLTGDAYKKTLEFDWEKHYVADDDTIEELIGYAIHLSMYDPGTHDDESLKFLHITDDLYETLYHRRDEELPSADCLGWVEVKLRIINDNLEEQYGFEDEDMPDQELMEKYNATATSKFLRRTEDIKFLKNSFAKHKSGDVEQDAWSILIDSRLTLLESQFIDMLQSADGSTYIESFLGRQEYADLNEYCLDLVHQMNSLRHNGGELIKIETAQIMRDILENAISIQQTRDTNSAITRSIIELAKSEIEELDKAWDPDSSYLRFPEPINWVSN